MNYKSAFGRKGLLSLAFLFLLLSSCTSSIYYVATETTFEKINRHPNKRKVIYLDQSIAPISRLDLLSTAINKQKWRKFDEEMNTFAESDQIFFKGIRHLIEKNYRNAYWTFDSLNGSAYDGQIDLLKTDCQHEMAVDSVNIRAQYQASLDNAQSEIMKSIIKTRYRFLRYEL